MIICGTGHRPNKLGGYGEIAARKSLDLARNYLAENKPDTVISGMALGWDQALALAAFKEGIEVWAYIPFKGQESIWPATAKTLYAYILARCSFVRYISEPGFAAWKMQARNGAMVDDADLVLALWNGSSGGTKNCIDYALSKGKPVVNLWPQYETYQIGA